VAWASVAVPFVIAAGFALAAIAVILVERFGQVAGYEMMAGSLAALGMIAALIVSQREEVAEQQAKEADTGEVMSDATAQAVLQAPLAVAGALFAAAGGATSALKIAGVLGRNFPLV
jgi:hypothetical protein